MTRGVVVGCPLALRSMADDDEPIADHSEVIQDRLQVIRYLS
jgi:hypothetical protein